MKDLKSKKDIFIEEATRIHGKKFNYSEIEYINTRIKVKIYCNSCKIYFNHIDLIEFGFGKFKGYTECFDIEHYESIKFLIDKYNLGHQ